MARQQGIPQVLKVLEGRFGIARLEPSAPWPEWLPPDGFCSVTRTDEELSVVCTETLIPPGVRAERGWGGIKIEGPLDFDLLGILASIATVLSDAGISLFAVSTFDTDYVLVRHERLGPAMETLTRAGFRFVRPGSQAASPADGREH